MEEYIVVYITAASKTQAMDIANRLVEEKLAACASIVDNVTSVFRWNNAVDIAQEAQIIVKTRRELFSLLVNRVKQLHSYQVPEIIALPIVAGSDDYLSWIKNVTQSHT